MTRKDNEIERMIREKVHDPDYHGINTVIIDTDEIDMITPEIEVIKREPSMAHQNGIKLLILIVLILIFFLL